MDRLNETVRVLAGIHGALPSHILLHGVVCNQCPDSMWPLVWLNTGYRSSFMLLQDGVHAGLTVSLATPTQPRGSDDDQQQAE